MRCKIIIPSSGIVELQNDVDISLTFQIADVKTPQKRNADFSKTIVVPGSDNNNKIFQHIFDIGIDRLYNPNKKANVLLVADSVTVMKGYMRLKNVINNDKKISYEVEITGRLADLFTVLGDTKVSELTWSDLDHTYSQANQVASWVAPIGHNYVYPFIDYGLTPNEIDYTVNNFFPAVYVKEIWDRIFSWAGFQYSSTSNFFTSTLFKSLILPFNSDAMRLTTAQIEARRFRASRAPTIFTGPQTIPVTIPTALQTTDVIFDDDTTSPNVDSGNAYNTSTGIWTCPSDGYYYLESTVNLSAYVIVSVSGGAGSYAIIGAYARFYDITNSKLLVGSAPSAIQGMKIPTLSTGTQYFTFGVGAQGVLSHSPSTNGKPIFIANGTQIKVQILNSASQYGAATISSAAMIVQKGSFFFNKVDPVIKEGDIVTMANVLPQKMKMSDFVNSIIKMFNIYTEYDKDVPNKLLMNPRNSFYGTTIQDWTQKRDLSKDLEIIPMGALDARYYKFTYKEDKDFYNNKYQSENGETYGQRLITVDNDFLKNTHTEELIFSPTPLDSSSASALNVGGVSNDDRYFPKIINIDDTGKVSPKVSNPRILYYGGVKSCKPWNYKSELTGATSGVTNYPYCGHMDDAITPTVDLNFGLPREIYYQQAFNAIMTNNNLYNVYWKQEIDEITDKNSSIVVGWFHLTAKDISILNFADVYRFDFQNFRLNKIYDYNPLSDGLTKCEFIKIKGGIPFTAQTYPLTGGSNGGLDQVPPVWPRPRLDDPHGVTNYGKINNVGSGSSNIIISGDYNSVGQNSSNVTILNSSGCVVPGNLVNVTILNSSGVTVTEDNTVVINNQIISSPTSNYSQWISSGVVIYNGNQGNVGVGTNNPGQKLEVKNDTIATSPNDIQGIRIRGNDNRYYDIGRESLTGLFKIYGSQPGANGFLVTGADGERFKITTDGRMYGTQLHNNAGAVTGTTNQYVASGTYTPTLTNISNTSTHSANQSQWMRVGNVVTVSGYLSVTSTATAICSFTISLPIASAISNIYELGGSATGYGTSTPTLGRITGYATTDTALVEYSGSVALSPFTFSYTFTYLVL